MSYTSERVSPSNCELNIHNLLIYLLHEKTYRFVKPHIKNLKVLDLGCGDGYGTKILTEEASHIIGVDISKHAINAARMKYPDKNITFQTIRSLEIEPLPFKNASFDAVISFQVIEHIGDTNKYLNEINRVLKINGKFFLSTPNASYRLLPFQNPWNKFHIKEFTIGELSCILAKNFDSTKLYGLGFKEPWATIERNRTTLNKWLLWPITNKLVPASLRKIFLHIIWKIVIPLKYTKKYPFSDDQEPSIENVTITEDLVELNPCIISISIKKDHEV